MQVVPVRAIANQTLQVQLGGQACILNVYQNAFGLFMDVIVGNSPIVQGVICLNLNRIVRSAYLGFVGDFAFMDTQASSAAEATDPVFTGLGDRYQLLYLEETDLPAGEA